jgi:hypothetical protein
MPDQLPRAGVRATIEDIEKFQRDAKAYNAALNSMKVGTQGATQAHKQQAAQLGQLPSKFNQVQSSARQLASQANSLAGQASLLSNQMTMTGASAASMAQGILAAVGTVGVATTAISLAVGGVKASLDALARVEPLWQARDAYMALSGGISSVADTLVQETQRASQFTVSEYKIITSANQDLLAGYDQLVAAYPKLMTLATTVAAATGQSVESSFNKITAALRSGSQSALESAGVWMDVQDAQEDYAAQSNRTIDQLRQEEKQLIAIQVVLDEMDEYIAEMGGATESALTPIRQLKSEFGLLKDEILAIMGSGILGFLKAIGLDLPGAISGARTRLAAGQELQGLFADVRKAYQAGEIPPDVYEEIARQMLAGRRGVSIEGLAAQMAELLGREAPGAVVPELTLEEQLAAETREAIRLGPEGLERQLTLDALRRSTGLAPYLTFEETEAARQRMLRDIEAYIDHFGDVTSPQARYQLELMTAGWDEFASAVRKASQPVSLSRLKELNKYLLYTAGAGMGDWARAFAREHGGRSPMQAYARHEDPLQAAMIDRLWGEQFARQKGRPPTEAEWRGHWYEQWAPLEAYPGGPIAKATGALAEQIDKMLADDNLGGLDDVFHDTWKKSKDLAPTFEDVRSEAEILAEFTGETLVPSMEDLGSAGDQAADALYKLRDAAAGAAERDRELPPPGGTPTGEIEVPEDVIEKARDTLFDVGPKRRPGAEVTGGDVYIDEEGRAFRRRSPGSNVWEEIESFQRGGITRMGGIFRLHPNEVVAPLNRLTDMMTNMRMTSAGAGQLVIQNLSIPVTLGAGHPAGVASDVQQAVIGAIRGPAGMELIRAGRRLGL